MQKVENSTTGAKTFAIQPLRKSSMERPPRIVAGVVDLHYGNPGDGDDPPTCLFLTDKLTACCYRRVYSGNAEVFTTRNKTLQFDVLPFFVRLSALGKRIPYPRALNLELKPGATLIR